MKYDCSQWDQSHGWRWFKMWFQSDLYRCVSVWTTVAALVMRLTKTVSCLKDISPAFKADCVHFIPEKSSLRMPQDTSPIRSTNLIELVSDISLRDWSVGSECVDELLRQLQTGGIKKWFTLASLFIILTSIRVNHLSNMSSMQPPCLTLVLKPPQNYNPGSSFWVTLRQLFPEKDCWMSTCSLCERRELWCSQIIEFLDEGRCVVWNRIQRRRGQFNEKMCPSFKKIDHRKYPCGEMIYRRFGENFCVQSMREHFGSLGSTVWQHKTKSRGKYLPLFGAGR